MTVRTVISLSTDDKAWLDQEAARQSVSMTEVVRRAVRAFRQQQAAEEPSLEEVLAQTRNIWPAGDGLAFQLAQREEW